jgi:acetyl esterase/lipase
MPSRREFLRGSLAGAAALALLGCSEKEQDLTLRGIQPVKYGNSRSQVAELLLPDEFGPFPVVVLIHGGWWRPGWDRRGVRELARDLADRGFATWNVEYRLVGEDGGGWPGTFEDIAAGIDELADRAADFNLDTSRVAFVGHSAGGQLALWAASRSTFEAGFVGSDPKIVPASVVAQAPVADLIRAADENLGNGAVRDLLGGTPDEVPLTYLSASPTVLEPGPSRHLLIHSVADDIVPVSQSHSYVESVTAKGGEVEMIELPDGGHFDVIDVDSAAWAQIRDRMEELVRAPGSSDEEE